MVNYSVRSGLNWFDRRVLARRSAKIIGRQNSVATAQEERRRFITLGLRMTFASLAAQPNRRWGCRLRVESFGSARLAAPLDRCQPRARLESPFTFRMCFPTPEASESQSGADNAGNVDQLDACASSGVSRQQMPARLLNLRFISFRLFAKAIAGAFTSDLLEETPACSNDRPSTMAAHLNRLRPTRERLRSGTSASARPGCRRKIGA